MTLTELGSRPLSRNDGPVQGDEPDKHAASARDYRDALKAVREALEIPHGATAGDQCVRDVILVERAGHVMVMLNSILRAGDPAPDVPWTVSYLRARLAEHPAEGYKTWDRRVAELETLKAQDGGR